VAAFGAGTGTKKQLINHLQRFATINHLYVSSFNAIAKRLLLITIKLKKGPADLKRVTPVHRGTSDEPRRVCPTPTKEHMIILCF
jgi:hypothetical protein